MSDHPAIDRLKALKPKLIRDSKITRLRVFGSVVTGDAHRDSDIDILLDFDDVPTLCDLSEIYNELTAELGMEVDIALADQLLPEFEERILKEAVDV